MSARVPWPSFPHPSANILPTTRRGRLDDVLTPPVPTILAPLYRRGEREILMSRELTGVSIAYPETFFHAPRTRNACNEVITRLKKKIEGKNKGVFYFSHSSLDFRSRYTYTWVYRKSSGIFVCNSVVVATPKRGERNSQVIEHRAYLAAMQCFD